MQKKKVAIIGTNGLPANYGGFETMTNYLTKQKNQEFDFFVFCGKTPEKEKRKTKQVLVDRKRQCEYFLGATVCILPLKPDV